MNRVTAILPAAGLGTRMGADTPKQFLIARRRSRAALHAAAPRGLPGDHGFRHRDARRGNRFRGGQRRVGKSWPAGSRGSRRRFAPGFRRQRARGSLLRGRLDSGARRGPAARDPQPDRTRDRGSGRLRRGHPRNSGDGHGEGSEAREPAERRRAHHGHDSARTRGAGADSASVPRRPCFSKRSGARARTE